jgi:hypothetical protein
MPHLEPTYLRYIYDGLIKGSIHPENAAELPEGLVGMYEEAFDDKQPVHLRQQLLERFAIWALLKKEVSAQFVAEVLNQPEEEIHEFIATYSAWFNSPESGKYQLYHERLKVYLLQKLSEGEVHVLHEKLISRLEQAIEEQKADEFEWYGLENLCFHLTIRAFESDKVDLDLNLFDRAISKVFWERQRVILGSYRYSGFALKSALSYYEKSDPKKALILHEKFIELSQLQLNKAVNTLNNFHLFQPEQILQSIEDFFNSCGNEEDKFFVYLGTLLMKVKNYHGTGFNYRSELYGSIVNFLTSKYSGRVFNWNNFIPESIMLDISAFALSLEIEPMVIFETLIEIEIPQPINDQWVGVLSKIKNPRIRAFIELELMTHELRKESNLQFVERSHIFFVAVELIEDATKKSKILIEYIRRFGHFGFFDSETINLAWKTILGINGSSERHEILVLLVKTLVDKKFHANIEQIVQCLTKPYWKCLALQSYFVGIGRTDRDSIELLLGITESISNESVRNESYKELCSSFGEFHYHDLKAIAQNRITSQYWKSMALLDLCKVHSDFNEIKMSLIEADKISRDAVKSEAYLEIALYLIKIGKISAAKELIAKIPSLYWKSYALCEIIVAIDDKNKSDLIFQIKDLILTIENEEVRGEAYYNLIKIINTSSDLSELIETVQRIGSTKYQKLAYRFIMTNLNNDKGLTVLCESYILHNRVSFSQIEKNNIVLSLIALPEFHANWNKLQKILKYSTRKQRILFSIQFLKEQRNDNGIDLDWFLNCIEGEISKLIINSDQSECLYALCELYMNNSPTIECIEKANSIPSPYWRSLTYLQLYDKFNEHDVLDERIGNSILALENQGFRDEVLYHYYTVLVKSTSKKAHEIFETIDSNYWKVRGLLSQCEILNSIARPYISILELALTIAQKEVNEKIRSEALLEIGLFCLQTSNLTLYQSILRINFNAYKKEHLKLIFLLKHFDKLKDNEIINIIHEMNLTEEKFYCFADLMFTAIQRNRFLVVRSCLDKLTVRGDRLKVFKFLCRNFLVNENLIIPNVLKFHLEEIFLSIGQQFDLSLLNTSYTLFYLRNALDDERTHQLIYQQFFLKDYFLEKSIQSYDYRDTLNHGFDIQWAIDLKKELDQLAN